ncbi:MAG: hypothetical protein H6907_04360 [Hyphomicrobiales bacterium]|nr:hypothetical protein [Hyphomicrobiales bacterium]
MSFPHPTAAGTGAGALALLLAATAPAAAAPDSYDDALARAALHQISLQLPSGLLRYDFDFLADKGEDMKEISEANLARQAGSAFGLAEYYRDSRDESLRAPLKRLLEAFVRLSVPVGKGGLQTAVEALRLHRLPFAQFKLRSALRSAGLLYLPRGEGLLLSPDGRHETAWAGITALALLAEINYAKASGDDGFASARLAWRRGLEMLHLPGAGIRENPNDLFESAYANGETWLAFATYAAEYPGDKAFEARLADLDDYVIATYTADPANGFFHWGAITANLRRAATGDPRFVDFSADQARWALASQAEKVYENYNSCGLIEGLGSALATLRDGKSADARLVERLAKRVGTEMAKNLSLQIPDGTRVLDLAGDVRLEAPRLADNAGAFLAGWSQIYVRIDITQHCMSAMGKLRRHGLVPARP